MACKRLVDLMGGLRVRRDATLWGLQHWTAGAASKSRSMMRWKKWKSVVMKPRLWHAIKVFVGVTSFHWWWWAWWAVWFCNFVFHCREARECKNDQECKGCGLKLQCQGCWEEVRPVRPTNGLATHVVAHIQSIRVALSFHDIHSCSAPSKDAALRRRHALGELNWSQVWICRPTHRWPIGSKPHFSTGGHWRQERGG